MSRSRKKHAIFKGGGMGTTAEAKGFANRRVRRYKKDISDGNWYRKIFNQYDIYDFRYDMDWKPELRINPCRFFDDEENFYWCEPDPKWRIYRK